MAYRRRRGRRINRKFSHRRRKYGRKKTRRYSSYRVKRGGVRL